MVPRQAGIVLPLVSSVPLSGRKGLGQGPSLGIVSGLNLGAWEEVRTAPHALF